MREQKSLSTARPPVWDVTSSSVFVYHNLNVVEIPATETSPAMYEYDQEVYTREEYQTLLCGQAVDKANDAVQKVEATAKDVSSSLNASAIAFVTLAENNQIDDVTATEHSDLFSPWRSGVSYEVGKIARYNGALYRCVQAHTSQEDWAPPLTPALWTAIGDPAEEWPEWSRPVGAHDAYDLGAKVSHNGKHWTSTTAANVWEPGEYGWEES